MATLNSGTAGFHAAGGPDVAPARPAPRARKPQTAVEALAERRCSCCERKVPYPTTSRGKVNPRGNFIDGMCMHCAGFFGHEGGLGSYTPGCTNISAQETLDKIKRLRIDKSLLLLRDLSLAAQDGTIINLGAGDIFICDPRNPEANPDAPPDKDATWAMFTLKVQVGPIEVTLMPHEWSPIAFTTVMACKSAGEITEAFVSSDDKTGHFTPTPELRRQIVAMFGRLINARPEDDE